jgi:hypothetical protein
MTTHEKQGMCCTPILPFALKKYLKAKRSVMETQIFLTMQKIMFKKIP